jgi:YidC/Oxa1 family membrane protein insertase
MERNAILATVLVILILLGYQWYLSRHEVPVQDAPRPATTQQAEQKTAPPQSQALQPARPEAKPATRPKAYTPTAQLGLPARDVVVETPLLRVVLSTAGARATSWQLKGYKLDSGAPVDLVATPGPKASPGALAAWADAEQLEAVFQVDKERLDLSQPGASDTLTFNYVGVTGLQMQKRLTFRADRYEVEVGFAIRNLSEDPVPAQPRLAWGPGLRNSTTSASTAQPPTLWVDGKRMQEDLTTLSGERVAEGKLSWVALQDNYFTAALLPKDKDLHAFVMKGAEDQGVVGLLGPKQTLAPGGELTVTAQVYAGPRDLDTLKAVGHDLDQLIDLGWFDFVARPALWLLKFLYHYTGNYGIAIILITVLQKIAFHPLTHKSMKSMQAMQAVQPKVQALQERYKNNPQKKQEEMMALYRKHGVNPMGGCLPMLIQIPIFIALYNALSSSVEMWQARFLWIRDLTQPDSLFTATVWGGYDFSFNLLALLMGVSMWFQQKMTPTAGDPRQAQMMLWTMPIVFTFMFWGFPSGLVLYWFVNNILQIGQQWLINRGTARPSGAEGVPA